MYLQILLCAILVFLTNACVHLGFSPQDINANLQRRAAFVPTTAKVGIKNVRIFAGTHFRPGVLAISGDRITFNLKNVSTWVDGHGGYLLPGLIDSHAHPASVQDLHQLSSYGVTTVLNMACANYTVCASLKDQPGLTSFFTADHGVTAPNSTHAIIFQTPPELLITNASQASTFVDYAFGNDSDWLKITAEPHGPD